MIVIKKNKILVLAFMSIALITLGEIIADNVWGDGDGIITTNYIHKIIFFVQLVILYYIFFIVINKLYVLLVKNKISSVKILQFGGKLFFGFVIIISCFLILEITSRFFFPTEGTFDAKYPVENARKPYPYVMFKGAPFTKTGFGDEVYNKGGYRGSYPVMPKDSTELRVVFLGGSAAWEGSPTIPELLEKEFKSANSSNVKIYNFGVVSSESTMELICLLNEVINLSPDMVIMYNGANDINFPYKYDPRPGYPFNFLVYENNPFLMRNYPAFLLLAYKSNLIRLLCRNFFIEKFSKINELKEKVKYGSNEWRLTIASIYLRNLEKASMICNSYNAKLYCFFQPMVYFKKNLSDEEKQFTKNHKVAMNHHLFLQSIILNNIKTLKNKSPYLNFYDLSAIYDSTSEQVFRDEVHTLQSQKLLVAKSIFNAINK